MRKIKSPKYSTVFIEQFNGFENFLETYIPHVNEMSKKYANKMKGFHLCLNLILNLLLINLVKQINIKYIMFVYIYICILASISNIDLPIEMLFLMTKDIFI